MNTNNIITYSVDKNLRNKLYLSVQNGEVLLDVPWYYTKNQIQRIIEEKSNWILNKIKEYEEKNTKEYIRNEIVKIFGEDCKVKINYKNLRKPTLSVEGKNIKIYLPNKYKKLNREQILEKLIEKLYDVIAKKELETIMEKIRIKVGFAPEDYIIKRLDNKLAMCTDEKILVINPDIVRLYKDEIEYILLHQFCHLKFKTHSKKFYELISKYNKNFEEYEKRLKKYII